MSSCIVAPQPLAVEAGAMIPQRGGNAVDAAVTDLVQGVVEPQMCGLGGYALVNLHLAGEAGSISLLDTIYIDPRSGSRRGVADMGSDGMAMVV